MVPVAGHFAAYSFVDRIVEHVPGLRARGTFAIPERIESFPSCLVAEAVGQLAAWVAMDRIDFRGRPVAALATETVFHAGANPGDLLKLAVDILECDDAAVAYNGHASIDGVPVIELIDCLGPMLPSGDFDDPLALRERFALLCGAGATPGRFGGVRDLPIAVIERVAGERMRGTLDVPLAAPFFADHFSRRPVFPATLLLDLQLRAALELAHEAPGARSAEPRPVRVTHVKMRSFIAPGQQVEIGIELNPSKDGFIKAMLSARSDGRTVASARLEIAMEGIA
jgi:3-hydroxymyristoyl/3-hydroxydecanoyl-(acyl carrier protein) dehydratase